MINLNNFVLSLIEIAKSETVKLIGSKQDVKYENGVKTDIIVGTRYTVVCPNNGFQTFSVKIKEENPSITQEEINNSGGSIDVTFIGFEGKFFQNKNKDVLFSAKADKIEVIK